MTGAEITAYNLGWEIEMDTYRNNRLGVPSPRWKSETLTANQRQSLERLGEDAFAYWVLRGMRDSLARRGA